MCLYFLYCFPSGMNKVDLSLLTERLLCEAGPQWNNRSPSDSGLDELLLIIYGVMSSHTHRLTGHTLTPDVLGLSQTWFSLA